MKLSGGAILSLALLLSAETVLAENPGCAQARAIVAEVQQAYESGNPDHAHLLNRLATARSLCAPLGEAWKYSYCSAQALGLERDARIYRDRAVFNGISDLGCEASAESRRPSPRTAPLPGFVREKFALVVGIGRFQDSRIPSLQFASKDARDLAALLTDRRFGRFHPSNVTVLTDEQATRANILNALQSIFRKAQEDDLVLLYVSSHGSPRQDDAGLGGVGYIVTYDTRLDSIWVDALDYEGFSRQASMIKAHRKVVFLDTCYSGQARPGQKALFLESAGIDPKTARLFLSGEGTYVITSSKANEKSWESEELQNSYFTHHLLLALKSEVPPTLGEIFAVLSRDVPATVQRDKGVPQHPQMLPAGTSADLRIGVAPREVRPSSP